MKQTNNAIKFLMAQYRAIFKNAYFKGLTTAVALTAGLAAGAAQAGAASNDLTIDKLTDKSADAIYTIVGENGVATGTSGSGTYNKLSLTSESTQSITDFNGTIKLAENGNALNEGYNNIKNITLSGQGSLIIDTGSQVQMSDKSAWDGGLSVFSSGDGSGAKVSLKSILVDSGNLHAFNKNSGSVTIEADTIKVEGTPANQTTNEKYKIEKNPEKANKDLGRAVVQVGATDGSDPGSVTVGKFNPEDDTGSEIIVTGALGRININGTTQGTGAVLQGKSISITDGGAIQGYVKNSSSGKGFVKANTIHMKDGEFNVVTENSGDFTLTLDPYKSSGSDTEDTVGQFTAESGIICLNAKMTLDQGVIAVSKDTKFVSTGGTDDSRGLIINAGVDDNTKAFNVDEKTALKISTEQLNDYLNGGVEYGSSKTVSGSVHLTSGGMIELTTDADLAKFDYHSGSGTKDGQIVVSGDAIISGKNITVSDTLKSGDTAASVGGLDLYAENLTLGSNDYNKDSTLGFGEANAKNVSFVASGGEFKLANIVNLKSTREVTQGETTIIEGTTGTINGNLTVAATTGVLNVNGGFYNAEQITLSGGKVSVNALTEENKASGTQSKLTIDTLVLTNTANSEAKASGNGAELTISNLNSSADGASGTITADGGVVNLQGTDVQEVLNKAAVEDGSDKIKFTATNSGTLNVDGNLALNFTDKNKDKLSSVLDFAGGTLKANTFTVNIKDSSNSSYSGTGTLETNDLALNAYKTDGLLDPKTTATLGKGTYNIANRLSSANAKLAITGDAANATVNLGAKEEFTREGDTYYKPITKAGSINVKTLEVGKSGAVSVDIGAWTAQDISLVNGGSFTIGGDFSDINGDKITASLEGDKLSVTDGKFTVNTAGSATFNGLVTSKATEQINIAGSLTVNGGAVTEQDKANEVKLAKGSVNVGSTGQLIFEQNALTNSIFDADYKVKTSVKDSITIENNGIVKLNFASGSLSVKQLGQIKEDLFNNDNQGKINGVLHIGKAQIGDLTFETDGSIKWGSLKPVSDVQSDVTNDKLFNAKVTGVDSEFKSHVGSLESTTQNVTIAGNSSLNNAAGNNGLFASYNGKAADVSINNGSNLALRGSGEIGAISFGNDGSSLLTDGSGTVSIANIQGDGDVVASAQSTNVAKDVKVGAIKVGEKASLTVGGQLTAQEDSNIAGVLKVTGDAAFKGELEIASQADFAQDLTVDNHAGIYGNTTVAETATFKNGLEIGGDAILTAKNLDFSNGSKNSTISVGEDDYEENGETFKGSTGYLQADSVKLAGNTLIVDPAYGEKTSIAAIKSFTDTPDSIQDAGVVDGNLIVGKNAGLMLGKSASLESMKEFIAQYQDASGSLQADEVGSVAYLTDKLTLASGGQIILDSARSKNEILDKKDGAINNYVYGVKDSAGAFTPADLYLGSNTVLAVGEKVLTQGAAIHFDKENAGIMAADYDTTKIVLVGDSFLNSNKIVLFTDNDKEAGKDGVKILGDQDIRVESLNGLMYFDLKAGTETTGGTLELDITKTKSSFLGATEPMRDFLFAYASKTNNWYEFYTQNTKAVEGEEGTNTNKVERDVLVDDVADPALATLDKQNNIVLTDYAKKQGLTADDFIAITDANNKTTLYRIAHNKFLERVVRDSDGAAADQAARMGVLGGAAQAALSANASTYESISGRFGMGLNSSITYANNGQGSGLWVTPVYKSVDSDGFATQGHNYGADVDLYGLALGGDYTLSNGLRVGAMFNVGSGDADGNGLGAGVKNDFNYYGFGLYAGYTYDKFSVVGDLTYTVVDSDVDANTSVDKVSTSFDTDALSLGVTGQYNLDLNGVNVIPHAALRFTRLDMDNYNISGTDGHIGSVSSSSSNIFSVPVGVTIAKEFVGEAWTVKPSIDFTLTGNFGEDDLDSSVQWSGVSRNVGMNSEIVDNFTYGVSLGLGATNGNFSFGAGLNYTGSSNTDEFGITANARFTF